MHTKKLPLFSCTLLISISAKCGTAAEILKPEITPSATCVRTNEHLYVSGTGFLPGEQIQGYVTSSHFRSPQWILHADQLGNMHEDITFRNNINEDGPAAVQEYRFLSSSTNISFHVWYQTLNPTNDWNSAITSLRVEPIVSGNRSHELVQIGIGVAARPYNAYQVQIADGLAGPWRFVGDIIKSEDPRSEWSIGLQLPIQAHGFFRIAHPYGVCPCDF